MNSPSRACGSQLKAAATTAKPTACVFKCGWQQQLRQRSKLRLQVSAIVPTETPTSRNSVRAELSGGEAVPQAIPVASTSGRQDATKDANTCWHFAYGANMNFITLARRDVRVLSRDPALINDTSIKLVFKHQGGYATLERTDAPAAFTSYDQRVHGVLYKLSKNDFKKLQKREGGYTVQEIQVSTYDGRKVTALAFVSNPLFQLPQEVTPTEAYISMLREGAADNFLDPLYQAFLSSIQTVPSAGLGPEYYNTPSKYLGYSFLLIVACITAAFFFQQ